MQPSLLLLLLLLPLLLLLARPSPFGADVHLLLPLE
jgi:hypothetical protein